MCVCARARACVRACVCVPVCVCVRGKNSQMSFSECEKTPYQDDINGKGLRTRGLTFENVKKLLIRILSTAMGYTRVLSICLQVQICKN